MMDNYVKIQGDIIKSKDSAGVTIMTVEDSTDSITVISYQPVNASGRVEIIGKITDYKGSLEIEIEKISSIEN